MSLPSKRWGKDECLSWISLGAADYFSVRWARIQTEVGFVVGGRDHLARHFLPGDRRRLVI